MHLTHSPRIHSSALAATIGCALALTSCSNMEDVNKVNPTRLGVAAQFENFDSSDVGSETTSTTIELDGGHRVTGGLEVGALLSWVREETENDVFDPGTGASLGTIETTSELVLFGPQARYYLISEGQVQPWVTAGAGVASVDFSVGDESASESGSFVQGGVGFSYFASRWVAIETALVFGRLSIDEADSDYSGLSVGLSVFF